MPYRGAPRPEVLVVEAIEGTPPGTVVTGAPCEAAALVQPAPANVAGVGVAAENPPLAAQLGGTDNPPTAGAWPMPASTGAAPAAVGAAAPASDGPPDPALAALAVAAPAPDWLSCAKLDKAPTSGPPAYIPSMVPPVIAPGMAPNCPNWVN